MLLNLKQLVDDFLAVTGHLKIEITRDDIQVETLPMPHEPTDLPPGKAAVYIFSSKERVLKVGRVGQNSQARYKYQHYIPGSSSSNLSDSLLKDKNAVQRYDLTRLIHESF